MDPVTERKKFCFRARFELMIPGKGTISCPYERFQSGSLHCDGARYYAGAVGTGNVDGLRVHDISSESERGRGISSQLQRESIAITGAGGAIAAHRQTVARDHDVQEYALV